MKNLYIPISLPFSIELDIKKFTGQQTRCGPELLQQNMHSWLEEKIDGIILWTEVFYLPPYESYNIHCDGHEIDNKCKLNYIINGDNSTMHWYEAIDKDKIINAYSKSNTKYLQLEKDNIREIGQAILTDLNLVNVGEFHTIQNGKDHRWCLSIVVGDSKTKKRLDFIEVETRLKNYESVLR